MAFYLNEVHFDGFVADGNRDQYIELRSDSETQLPNGTYFVVIEGSSGITQAAGRITTMFDLSNQAFGNNGMLVLAQQGNRYEFDPNARVLQGTTTGFRGMPGDLYSTEHTLSSGLDFVIRSNSYLLIQTNVRPQLGQDIDAQDDGIPDGVWNSWNVLDGASALYWIDQGTPLFGYAPIVFRESGMGQAPIAKTVVEAERLAYLARIGDSTDYSPGDWVGGYTQEHASGGLADFRFTHGTFGTPRPFPFSGRFLDNVGASNFVGHVSGHAFHDQNDDGIKQASEPALSGMRVTVDTNQNGLLDSLAYRLEPDAYLDGAELTNELTGATLTVARTDNTPIGFVVRSRSRFPENPANPRLLASEGIPWFSNSSRLRIDFYRPADAISISFSGAVSEVYGRLEAFDAQNQSLGFVRTGALVGNQSQRISLTYPDARIAYAVAYCDDAFQNSSPFGQLDDLQYRIPEPSATTGANGRYEIRAFPAASQRVFATTPAGVIPSAPASGHYALNAASRTGRNDADFIFRSNRPPVFPNQNFRLRENEVNGILVGLLDASDPDPEHQLTLETIGGDPDAIFGFQGKNLVLRKTELVNFESNLRHVLIVKATDNFEPSQSTTATITISIDDVNDAPLVANGSKQIVENAPVGAEIARVVASDEDQGSPQEFTYGIVGGDSQNRFAIDPGTGAITLAAALDFESASQYVLVVEATEKTPQPKSGRGTISVTVQDVNEAPDIDVQTLTIVENSASGARVGSVAWTDPDQNQSHQFAIEGGDGASLFQVDGPSGALHVAPGAQLDFETKASYNLIVRIVDSGSPAMSATRPITISVADANDPPIVAAQSFSVAENTQGKTLIGTLTATDQDAGQSLSFSLLPGVQPGLFEVDATTGSLYVAAGSSLDFESLSSYVVEAEVQDNGSVPAKTKASITIQVTDRNDPPTLLPTTLAVVENAPAGASVGRVLGIDQDVNDAITYGIADQANFAIDSATGQVTVKAGASLSFEATPQIPVEVTLRDQAGATLRSVLMVQLSDANDPPKLNGSIPTQRVPLNLNPAWTYTLPADLFIDEDAGDTLRIGLFSGNGFSLPSWLSYVPATRVLTAQPTESHVGVHSILVNAIDSRNASAQHSFQLEVLGNLWHNYQTPEDVDGINGVSALDALLVINYLNLGRPSDAPQHGGPAPFLLDVSNDKSITALDVLMVINRLNRPSGGAGEDSPSSMLSADEHASTAWWDDGTLDLLAQDRLRRRNRS
jgi:hypothetical protein